MDTAAAAPPRGAAPRAKRQAVPADLRRSVWNNRHRRQTGGFCPGLRRAPAPARSCARIRRRAGGVSRMTPQTGVEIFLAVGALALLGRDLRRAWRDELRRPISLLVAALVSAL